MAVVGAREVEVPSVAEPRELGGAEAGPLVFLDEPEMLSVLGKSSEC